jgi:UDP-N-acetylmuramyl tripeptide synthase
VASLRLSAAIALGKLTAFGSRLLGMGGGTTMPGRVARAIAPNVVATLAARLPSGTIVVTGTNGKTTTSRLISHILRQAGLVSVHNRAGANLAAGIASTLVHHTALGGTIRGDVGIFEVDEATLPLVQPALHPRVVVLTNLFRDQLDRYGEIDIVAGRWETGLAETQGAAVIFNADDPLVAAVATRATGRRVAFGIGDASCSLGTLEHAADARYCYQCGVPYEYRAVYFGHMGIYRCPQCGTERPAPDVVAQEIEARGLEGNAFTLLTPRGSVRVQTILPGVYNLHNVLAAAACSLEMGVALPVIARGIETFAPAFGRAERVRVNAHEAVLLLAKNPAGFNEVLRTVLRDGDQKTVLIAINDLTADGRDISWLWDVDFEMLAGRVRRAIISGIRAHDMDLRLKHAGIPDEVRAVSTDLAQAFDLAMHSTDGGRLYVLPTYTAMLQLRKILQGRGHVSGFWED